MARNRIILAFNNAGLGWMSGHESRVILFAPNPAPKFALFLAHPRKRAEKEGCRSNAAEAGRAEAEVQDGNQDFVWSREGLWFYRALGGRLIRRDSVAPKNR